MTAAVTLGLFRALPRWILQRVEGADPIDIEVKLAVVLGSDAVKSLVRRHAARAAELGAALDRAERTIERLHRERDQVGRERDQFAEERQRLIEERRRLIEERDRYVAELRAIRRARGELPRTGNDLRKWREERGLTQVEAAQRLAVGRATLERARPLTRGEGQAPCLALASWSNCPRDRGRITFT